MKRLAAVACACALAGCVAPEDLAQRDDGVTDVVATTQILADLATNIAGDTARVTSLVPPGADPHSYEPTLRDVRAVANADLVLTNHLLLEDQAIMDTVNNSTLPGTPVIKVAEEAEAYGADLRPLVEDLKLDTAWLGARVAEGEEPIDLVAVGATGPGELSAFLTGTFGQPLPYIDTSDGLGETDLIRLPAGAHTHMSWGFTEAGHYELQLEARSDGTTLGSGTVRFDVGIHPSADAIKEGHLDVAYRDGRVGLLLDDGTFADAPVAVPGITLQQVPADPAYRFLGRPGDEVYLLPQAVLGKHVHGEIDPHLWHDVGNAQAYVRVIEREITRANPADRDAIEVNAEAYQHTLSQLDQEVTETLEQIPPERRHLVTTHDAYSYLARAYGLEVAGVVSPNPAIEPSTSDVIALTRTLQNLRTPAVFIEPTEPPGTLSEIAGTLGIRTCTLHGDALTEDVPTYLDLMRHNANEIKECLT